MSNNGRNPDNPDTRTRHIKFDLFILAAPGRRARVAGTSGRELDHSGRATTRTRPFPSLVDGQHSHPRFARHTRSSLLKELCDG